LRKRFSDLGVDASVTVNTSDKSLRVSVSQADSDSAKFLITERGLVEFSRVFQARNSPAQTCRPNADAFGKKAIAAGGAVQCDPADGLILLLGPVALTQANFTNAVAKTSPGISGWEVALTLDHPGVTAWGALTRGAYASTGSGDAGFATCKPPRGCNALAFVIDGGLVEVPSVPRAGGLPGTTAAISGDFSEALAKRIAATLKSGPLPVAFAVP
jgi:preprotein translocase subunit SecD